MTTLREGFLGGIGGSATPSLNRWRLRRKVQAHISLFSENAVRWRQKITFVIHLSAARFPPNICAHLCSALSNFYIATRGKNAGQKKPGSAFGGRGRAARLLALRHIGGCPERSVVTGRRGFGGSGIRPATSDKITGARESSVKVSAPGKILLRRVLQNISGRRHLAIIQCHDSAEPGQAPRRVRTRRCAAGRTGVRSDRSAHPSRRQSGAPTDAAFPGRAPRGTACRSSPGTAPG